MISRTANATPEMTRQKGALLDYSMKETDSSSMTPSMDVLTSHNGGIYHDDHEALEALHLVAKALGQSVTVQVLERPPL